MRHGRPRWHGLGSLELVSLAEARDAALVCRKMLLEGVDPIEAKGAPRKSKRSSRAGQRHDVQGLRHALHRRSPSRMAE